MLHVDVLSSNISPCPFVLQNSKHLDVGIVICGLGKHRNFLKSVVSESLVLSVRTNHLFELRHIGIEHLKVITNLRMDERSQAVHLIFCTTFSHDSIQFMKRRKRPDCAVILRGVSVRHRDAALDVHVGEKRRTVGLVSENLEMRVVQHAFVPRLWRTAGIEEKSSGMDEFDFIRNLVRFAHEPMVHGLCEIAVLTRILKILIVRRIADHVVEKFSLHGRDLLQCLVNDWLSRAPVENPAWQKGVRLRVRDFVLFGGRHPVRRGGSIRDFVLCGGRYPVRRGGCVRDFVLCGGGNVAAIPEKLQLYRRVHLARLRERRLVSQPIHLPHVPGDAVRHLAQQRRGRRLAPPRRVPIDKRQQQVDSRNEQAVALVLVAIRRLNGANRPCRPFVVAGGVLAHDAQLAVEHADAPFQRNARARRRVIARSEIRRFAARDFKATRIHVLPPRPPVWERDRRIDDLPRAVAARNVEDIATAEPVLVADVVHPIAKPGGRRHLRLFPGADGLRRL